MDATLDGYLQQHRKRVEQALEAALPNPEALAPADLAEAVRYAVLGGGKRLRPILVLAACEACGGNTENAWAPAAAVELIHAYSLCHDDLPALDDDDLRRGRATTHRAYSEPTAILVGDALQNLAIRTLADAPELSEAIRLRMVATLAAATGTEGMVGGQALDMSSEAARPSTEALERIHRLKTGALLRASLELGALAAGASADQARALTTYGGHVGLAFQIVDDILDVEGDTADLGKTAGADEERAKATYPALLGLEASRERARAETDAAVAALDCFGAAADPLRTLARYITNRSH